MNPLQPLRRLYSRLRTGQWPRTRIVGTHRKTTLDENRDVWLGLCEDGDWCVKFRSGRLRTEFALSAEAMDALVRMRGELLAAASVKWGFAACKPDGAWKFENADVSPRAVAKAAREGAKAALMPLTYASGEEKLAMPAPAKRRAQTRKPKALEAAARDCK